MIVILKENEEHILVIWLIEWNKDNDSRAKKSPNLFLTWMVTYAQVV